MAIGPDERSGAGGAGGVEWVVRRSRTVAGAARRVEPQDLPVERVQALGQRGVVHVARGHIQLAVGAELDPPPVVVAIALDAAVEDGHGGDQVRAVVEQADHAVVVGPRDRAKRHVEVDEAVGRVVGVQRHAEELVDVDVVVKDGAEHATRLHLPNAPGALGHQRAPVGRDLHLHGVDSPVATSSGDPLRPAPAAGANAREAAAARQATTSEREVNRG